MDYPEVVIASFARTPIGSFLGTLSSLPAAAQDGGRRAPGKETGVERLMRDAKITQIYEGTPEIQRVIIASELKKKG